MKVSCRESLAIHRNRVAPGKARLAVQHSDASLLQSAFDAAGHRVGEHALGGDHVRPVDGGLCFEHLAVEAVGPFDTLRYRDQQFVRVAPPQYTVAAKGQAVAAGDSSARAVGSPCDDFSNLPPSVHYTGITK